MDVIKQGRNFNEERNYRTSEATRQASEQRSKAAREQASGSIGRKVKVTKEDREERRKQRREEENRRWKLEARKQGRREGPNQVRVKKSENVKVGEVKGGLTRM